MSNNQKWTEVALPPIKVENIAPPESVFNKKASIDIRSVKFILEDEDGGKRIKFYDNEVLYLDASYLLELLPK